ncbi:TPA: conjugal transfer protein TraD [Legionella pneumophila]|uniref:conjugal transfer protein TraD n=1 Tax=Legionella pneumophila TaxID=446 RepID=UPI000D063B78|nr:conjugal transfer protein TraD [Legionella pneumophila]HAT7006127.1 conjugal transfer protein TraD [Legionella pneumophila]HAU0773460.1 conjugal transfer protein TraD [Legionella pneumophila]HAU1229879.1 conjugal transfer protein TraD [Legionella pneumophila]HDV4553855.1 conjugal transfer protein TraD [Legionella pneumophila]
MTMLDQIEKERQLIARCEKNLAMEKLKKRKADTQRKIELGGLVIKSKFDTYDKLIILGALIYALELISQDIHYTHLFETIGTNHFNNRVAKQ